MINIDIVRFRHKIVEALTYYSVYAHKIYDMLEDMEAQHYLSSLTPLHQLNNEEIAILQERPFDIRNKIRVVKLLRNRLNICLKEAKESVDFYLTWHV